MQQQHITSAEISVAAIDEIVKRGSLEDWCELRAAALSDPEVLAKLEQVARRRIGDRSAMRCFLWTR